MAYKRLGDLLKSVGLITEEQLQTALAQQSETNDRLGKVLIETGVISEVQLIEALKLQLGLDFIDLSQVRIPPEMSQVLPKNLARQHGVVPVKVVKDELFLAMSDPLDFVALENVKSATRKRVVPLIATATAVDQAIMTLYGNEGAARAIEEMRWEGGGREEQATFNSSDLDEESQSAPTVRLVNSIIERAVAERASDIHLEPRETEMVVRMRIDGRLRSILSVPRDLQGSVISRLKILSNMDIAERRTPQDGRANVKLKGADVDLRVSTLPTIYGETVVVRLLDKSQKLLNAEAIGLSGANLEKFNALLKNNNGMILLVGPTGSGKTSTMYTMIHALNTDEVNLVTLEDPVEYNLDGVNQVQINDKAGMTFAGGLRAILRQDPDIIAVGEIRDVETAEIAMRSAITGHLVLSTVHTGSALSALGRLMDIGVEPYLMAEALTGIISQRLVRRICPHCRVAYTPTPEELERLRLPADTKAEFYRGKGCPACFHTGYRGRIAVFEILILNAEIKRMIADRQTKAALQEAVSGPNFSPLLDNCQELVLNGTTTADEVWRTINTTEDMTF